MIGSSSSPRNTDGAPSPASDVSDPVSALEVEALKQRIAALEQAVFSGEPQDPHSRDVDDSAPRTAAPETSAPSSAPHRRSKSGETSPLWALETLRQQVPEPGAVMLVGSVTAPNGQHAQWQYGALSDDLFGSDFASRAETMSALSHPVRLRILQHLLDGAETVQDLTADGAFGTSGQIYHHLKILVSAGWLSAGQRSHYYVPAERLVPLLAILTGATR